MLNLKNIVKTYKTGDETVAALKGVSVRFRKNEFVSILGQSGCGKTTLLNIIGGLDRYTDGDLIIAGKSTKQFRDADWDNYRNRSIGFVFQSYNLIPHQTVLSNVELALTLSGVSKHERRVRAKQALEKVGLGDQLKKKPNQMSGGQMQRVAIARALVNNPEILLADEPTGALDSETSVQIMELLKEVAKDRLVIMVTHNPELAQKYSTRIIRLLDGEITDDSDPYTDEEAARTVAAEPNRKSGKKKKPSMSFWTALSLSVNNLLTKKARTILTSFAGSIGIIGIALIMSVSTGVQAYIDSIERSTMASYPITISETTMDTSAMLSAFMNSNSKENEVQEENTVYSNDVVVQMMESMTAGVTTNNLKDFKTFLDSSEDIKNDCYDIKYTYSTGMNVYLENDDGTYTKGLMDIYELYDAMGMDTGSASDMVSMSSSSVWTELVGDRDYINDSYDVLYGHLPENKNEVVLIVNDKNQVSDYTLYSLGLRDVDQLKEYFESAQKAVAEGKENEYKLETRNYTFEELCNQTFSVLTDADYYNYDDEKKLISEASEAAVIDRLKTATKLKIVGIVRPSDEDEAKRHEGTIGYTTEFMNELINNVNGNAAVKAQLDNSQTDLFSGLSFEKKEYTADEIRAHIANDPEMSQYVQMPDDMLLQYGAAMMETSATYEGNLSRLGYVDREKPSGINLYPKDFEAKERVTDAIETYNDKVDEADKITYTDMVAMLMSSVTTIVNAISYVLIAFVAISLIVSSIMIGIITYISVLERTKEIGILRSIGASKRDISRVFNAETTIVGLTAGVIGIVITLLLLIPINMILHTLTGISTLSATLPVLGAVILVAISILLTYVAGLIPSGFAAKRDPVEALRTE
jgi:putative ABC transport system permease protein